MTPIERATQAAWDELERQGRVSKHDAPHVDREELLIDGHIDLPAIVRAALQAIRDPSEVMLGKGQLITLNQAMSRMDWYAMIDAALAEGV